MSSTDTKKMSILQLLHEAKAPLSIFELMAKLPQTYAERSVRRWLTELFNDGHIEKVGKKRATKYRITSPLLKEENDRSLSMQSMNVVTQINRPQIERESMTYKDSFLEEYIPNRTFYLPFETRATLLKVGKRSKVNDPAGSYAHQIYNRLLIDLSYNSSRLEGNTYSLLETEKLVIDGTAVQTKSEEDKLMILNHKDAIRYIVDSAPKLRINPHTICNIHYLLSDGLIGKEDVGKVRRHAVRIGGSNYIPYSNPHKLHELLELITHKAQLIKDPFEQSFFLLIHLSYLQPFIDVNKRTARLSCNIPLIQHNLIPLSFNEVKREEYTSAILAVYELQDVRPMVDLYVFSYKHTCAAYDSTVDTMHIDFQRARYRTQRRQILSKVIIKKLKGKRMETYVKKEAARLIPKANRAKFIADTLEDLSELDSVRIAGLGITHQEFVSWSRLK